jgi:hypothetical protein
VKATPLSALAVFGLVMVKLKLVVPFSGMLAAPKALLIVGAATTVRLAVLLAAPVPPSVELTAPVVLSFVPAVVPVTSTENVHDEPAAGDAVSVPPDRLILPLPATAVIVPLPQEPVTLGVAATTRPEGRLSVNATPLRAMKVFGLVMVKLTEVVPFSGMLAAPNALLMVGGAATVKLAEAVLPVPPLVELTAPVVFVYWPAVVPVTFTTSVQLAFTAILPPVRLMLVDPATAVAVPPHVFDRPFGVETTKPVGKVSVNATPVSATVLAAGLVMVKVSVVVPFRAIVVGLKTLAIDGGATIEMLAVLLVAPVPPSVDVMAPVVLLASPAAVPVTFTDKVQDPL